MPKSPLARIRRGAILLAVAVVCFVIGYHFFGRGWIDSLYMVILTVATVGFTEKSQIEPAEQLFSIAVMLIGIGLVAYTFGGFVEYVTAGEWERTVEERRRQQDIQQLEDHTIVCGYGRMGQQLAAELKHHGEKLVVIEADGERVADAQREHLVVRGNATEEEVLQQARIDKAKALVTALPADSDNVFITLTARNLNPKVHIIARAEQRSTEKKLLQAGADQVASPAKIGAQRVAAMIVRPSSLEVMELAIDRNFPDLEIDEFRIPSGNVLSGKTLRELDPGFDKLLLVAVKPAAGNIRFNPGAHHQVAVEDTLILMGAKSDIQAFRERVGL
jgi:voltage-gated potassium channel